VAGCDVAILTDPAARPIIAHRGDSAHFPENTLESFEGALAAGADALKMFPAEALPPAALRAWRAVLPCTTDGTGRVADLTRSELQRLDAGARFTADGGPTHPFAGQRVRIPTLREVLALDPVIPLLIEVKVVDAALATLRLLDEMGALGRAVIGSFDSQSVRGVRGRGVSTTASSREVAGLLCRLVVARPRTLPYEVLSIPPAHRGVPLPIRAIASVARGAGVVVHVWTIDGPRAAESLWRAGVCGLVTNAPGPIKATRDHLFRGDAAGR